MKVQPVGKMVLIQVLEQGEQKSKGGILLPGQNVPYTQATVIAVGDDPEINQSLKDAHVVLPKDYQMIDLGEGKHLTGFTNICAILSK